jgi:hypothetical protein
MRSLNTALDNGKCEKIEKGNGVYEAFRSGYRVLNWLYIHNSISWWKSIFRQRPAHNHCYNMAKIYMKPILALSMEIIKLEACQH